MTSAVDGLACHTGVDQAIDSSAPRVARPEKPPQLTRRGGRISSFAA